MGQEQGGKLDGKLKGIAALAAASELVSAPRDVECFELPCRSLLNSCKTGGIMPFDFTINPYRGCELGCTYCYARYTHEFMELDPGRAFERKIFAKENAARVLARELARACAPGRPPPGPIAIGTATDPYQPLERRLGLTRSILEEIARHAGLSVSVTTKSDLVLRDVAVLQEIARRNAVHVNVTITTLDAALARTLEPRAPVPENRLRAVSELTAAGIPVNVSVAPILPFITDGRPALDGLLGAARAAGANDVWSQVLFLREATRPTFFAWLEAERPELVVEYRRIYAGSDYGRGPIPRMIGMVFSELKKKHRFPGREVAVPAAAASAGQLSMF
jgi:DNA repair photolyase